VVSILGAEKRLRPAGTNPTSTLAQTHTEDACVPSPCRSPSSAGENVLTTVSATPSQSTSAISMFVDQPPASTTESPPSSTRAADSTTLLLPSTTPRVIQSTPPATDNLRSTSDEPSSPSTATITDMATTTTQAQPCQYGCINQATCVWGCPGATCRDYNDCADPYPCDSAKSTCCNTGCFSGWTCRHSCLSPLKYAPVSTGYSTCQ
ncbi:hypothetical protein QBC46DRAFT_416200, partial [Diplogelasinospora grovesii]